MRVRQLLAIVGLAALLSVLLTVTPPPPEATAAPGGNTITSPDTVGDVGSATSVVLNAAGNPVVSYRDDSNRYLKLLVCGDATCSPGNTTITSPDTVGDVGEYTSLALNAAGNPVVSYSDVTNGDLKVLVCGDATCSSGNSITSPDTTGSVGWFTSLALNSSGNPVVSYYDSTNGDLKVLVCGDVTCSSGNTTRSPDKIGSVITSESSTSLALNGSGFPVISYRDLTTNTLKVLVCGDATCLSGNTIESPDFIAGDYSDFSSSLALNPSSGFPVVAYAATWAFGTFFKVLVCGDATCSSGNTVTSPPGGFYDDPSLALTSDGFPVVSGRGGPPSALMSGGRASLPGLTVLSCGDSTCSSGNTVTTADTGGATGFHPSLALDGGGFPVVSYHDGANGDLKVLVCGSATCVEASCPASAFVVDAETELVDAVDCYNLTSSGTTTITFEGDVTLTGALPVIDNDTGAGLTIAGAGYTLDGAGTTIDVLHQTDGVLYVYGLTIKGGTGDGMEVAGGDAVAEVVTVTGNGTGLNLDTAGSLVLNNSTVASNSSTGVVVGVGSSLSSSQATIVDNGGAGVDNVGTLAAAGILIARNGGADCTNLIGATDYGGSVYGDASCNGTAAAGLDASLDAGGLAPNNCTAPCTDTVALLLGSPAIDASGPCGFAFDQRGVPRPADDCDAGAFELMICGGRVVTIDMNMGASGTGTASDDVILGTPGVDIIDGLAGDDVICAGAGNDAVTGGDGADRIFGEAGADSLWGNDGIDRILGGLDNDEIQGGPGGDVLRGQAGNDLIVAANSFFEPGVDDVKGGGGADEIYGGGDADRLDGGAGIDTIYGGNGDDFIYGRGAKDFLHGDLGADTISGGLGGDQMWGGPGADIMTGNSGPDGLHGEDDDDVMGGGNGNDFLYGGAGFDKCAGNLNYDEAELLTCEQTPGVENLF